MTNSEKTTAKINFVFGLITLLTSIVLIVTAFHWLNILTLGVGLYLTFIGGLSLLAIRNDPP